MEKQWKNKRTKQMIKFSLTVYWLTSVVTIIAGTGVSMKGLTAEQLANSVYTGAGANVSTLLDSLLLGYDKRLRPNYKVHSGSKGPPVEIGISMHVLDVSSISEVDMSFTIDMFFRQHWQDARLAFKHADVQFGENEELCITQDMLDKIWWPDTYFANGKDAKFHYATTKNAFFRISPTGNITQSLRLTVTATCGMDLTYFPMDSQVCSLGIESYGYSTSDIDMIWQHGNIKSVAIEKDVQLPQFKIMGKKTYNKIFTTSTGNYTRLYVDFLFVRSLGYYIIQIYIPCVLVVVLSWVSFWLSREAVPARVALGITTVLTMTTLISSTNASLPKISYLKSIDIFLIFSFFMVFMSLMEYAAVSYMENKYKTMEKKKKKAQEAAKKAEAQGDSPIVNGETFVSRKQCEKLANYDVQPLQTEVRLGSPLLSHRGGGGGHSNENAQYNVGGHFVSVQPCRPRLSLDEEENNNKGPKFDVCAAISKPGAVDRYSRFLFPVAYSVFNIMYWVVYLNISKSDYAEYI